MQGAFIKHTYSGRASTHERPDNRMGESDLLIAARAAVAALTQNATHPADVQAAIKWLDDAIAQAN